MSINVDDYLFDLLLIGAIEINLFFWLVNI